MLRARSLIPCVLLCLAPAFVACEDKTNKSPAVDAGTSAAQTPGLDNPKLREALAAASASASARAVDPDGPPPGGVFPPELADARHAKNAPVKIQVGSEGADPKSAIARELGDLKGPGRTTIQIRTGPRSALPSVDLTLSFKLDKAKAGDKPSPASITAKVDKAVLSATQPGQIPAGTDKEIAKLTGSSFRITGGPSGGAEDVAVTVSKDTAAELKYVLYGAAEMLFAMYVPVPDKPVGVGAAWIAEARSSLAGLETISYRLYRVKSIDAGAISLDVEVRQYATGPKQPMEGMPAGEMQQFESVAQGQLKISTTSTFASQAQFDQKRGIAFLDGQRMMQLQMETEGKFSR